MLRTLTILFLLSYVLIISGCHVYTDGKPLIRGEAYIETQDHHEPTTVIIQEERYEWHGEWHGTPHPQNCNHPSHRQHQKKEKHRKREKHHKKERYEWHGEWHDTSHPQNCNHPSHRGHGKHDGGLDINIKARIE